MPQGTNYVDAIATVLGYGVAAAALADRHLLVRLRLRRHHAPDRRHEQTLHGVEDPEIAYRDSLAEDHAEELETRMVLQVHDELVFTAPEAEVERVQGLVREKMESVVSLKVPLKVDVGVGRTWGDAKD